MMTIRLTGRQAIALADTLNKYADPTEAAREGLSRREAEAVCEEDPSLIWVELPYNNHSASSRAP